MQLGETQGHLLSKRPFQTVWYCSQVRICIELWKYDGSLTHALELAKSFLIPLETLNALWPCPGNVDSLPAGNEETLLTKYFHLSAGCTLSRAASTPHSSMLRRRSTSSARR